MAVNSILPLFDENTNYNFCQNGIVFKTFARNKDPKQIGSITAAT